jgi:alpha-D-ribose 1-methylphosphonate 5-triphosphate synthase subunit PhnH
VRPLSPDESQRIFRAVLDALARPGTLGRLPAVPGYPAALLPLLALADLSTPACVVDDGGGWPGAVRALTSAPLAALPEARLVAALRPVTPAELAGVRTGTAAAPEEGALVTLMIKDFCPNGSSLLLTGPGVPGRRELSAAGLPAGFTAARRALTESFPAGADFLLVAPDGRVAGLPRTTTIEEAPVSEETAVLWGTRGSRAAWPPSSPPNTSSAASATRPPGCRRGTSRPGSGWRWTG